MKETITTDSIEETLDQMGVFWSKAGPYDQYGVEVGRLDIGEIKDVMDELNMLFEGSNWKYELTTILKIYEDKPKGV